MGSLPWSVRDLRAALTEGNITPTQLAAEALSRANSNVGRNTYLWRDPAWTLAEAARVEHAPTAAPLCGLPVSVKDCFDLAGAPTSCGVRFYRDLHGPASEDSWLVAQLRALGAVITGKTHLHPLAYGITGENPEFGDCLQPGHPASLTGGSSSGAAASVLEGSAVAAIGTDTGGSIRCPASLCRLVGYRSTIGRGDWTGAGHLAQSFDTMGWLFRHLEDAPLLAAPFAPTNAAPPAPITRFAVIGSAFLHDCGPAIVAALESFARELESLGLRRSTFDAANWSDSFDLFAPIQAWEAARIHTGHYDQFETSIRERLMWGARITDDEIAALRACHTAFRASIDALISEHELLVLPATPVTRFVAGADQSQTRARVLRYTTPFSLAGVPVVTVPAAAAGMQLATARNADESLLDLAARIGAQRKALV
ncbi:MAG: amidase family protein [Terracidiphilus sp.]|nr:amidase family protein [Terracidiphilus sp.]